MNKNRGDVSKLIDVTNKNYDVAVKYYQARRRQLMSALAKSRNASKIGKAEQNLADLIENDLMKTWNKIYEDIINELVSSYSTDSIDNKNKAITFLGQIVNKNSEGLKLDNAQMVSRTIDKLKGNYGLSDEVFESLVNEAKGYGDTGIYSILGHIYEVYIVKYFNECLLKTKQVLSSSLDEIISPLEQLGKTPNVGGFRKEGTENITDIGFFTPSKSKSKNSVNGGSTSFSASVVIEENSDEITTNLMVKKYLNSGKFSNQYGINVKNWGSGLSNQHLTQASYMRNLINKEFRSSNDNTWNLNYAEAYSNLMISKYLLPIIGATNVVLFTRNSMYWIDDILDKNLLYMEIQADGMSENNEAINPKIYDNYLYIRNKTRFNNLLKNNNSSIELATNSKYNPNEEKEYEKQKPYVFKFITKKN